MGNEFSWPTQQSVWREQCIDLTEKLAAQRFRPDSQTTALSIGECDLPPTELRLQHPVLFFQIVDDLLLLMIEPQHQSGDQILKRK